MYFENIIPTTYVIHVAMLLYKIVVGMHLKNKHNGFKTQL